MFDAKILNQDEKMLFVHKSIRVKGAMFESPIKAITAKNLLDVDINYRNFISEVYRVLRKENLSNMVSDEYSARIFNQKLRQEIVRARNFGARIVLFIPALQYMSLSDNELSFIVDTQTYSDFDFYVVPTVLRISKLLKPGVGYTIDDYLDLIKRYLDIVKSYNIKPIMGMIPITIPYQYISNLVEFYLRMEVDAFCIDFGGRVPLNLLQSVSLIHRLLKQNGIETYIHATNANIGKPSKRSKVIIAKDILALGLGIDSIGDNHIPIGGEWRTEFKESNLRLFNKEKYGYHRVSDISELESMFPYDSKIRKEDLLHGSLRQRLRFQNIFNYEQIGLETNRLKKVIGEQNVISYIKQKEYVTDDLISQIIKAKKDVEKTPSIEEIIL